MQEGQSDFTDFSRGGLFNRTWSSPRTLGDDLGVWLPPFASASAAAPPSLDVISV